MTQIPPYSYNTAALIHHGEYLKSLLTYPVRHLPKFVRMKIREERRDKNLFTRHDEEANSILGLCLNSNMYLQADATWSWQVSNAERQVNSSHRYVYNASKLKTKNDVIRRIYENFRTHICLQSFIDLESRLSKMCEQVDCSGVHSPELIFKDFNFNFQVEATVEEVMNKNGFEKWIAEQVSELLPPELANLMEAITGNEADVLLNKEVGAILSSSIKPVVRLLNKTPGIVGVWVYCVKNYSTPLAMLFRTTASREPYEEPVEHEGQIVTIVSKALDVKPNTKAWKLLAKMPAEEAYTRLSRISRKDALMSLELKTFGAALKIEAMAGFDLRDSIRNRIEKVISLQILNPDIDADWTALRQLLLEFARQSRLTNKERGYSLGELNRTLTHIMDWVTAKFQFVPPEECVLTQRKWNGFVKASARWHRDAVAEAMELERKKRAEQGGVDSWDSLVPEYAFSQEIRVVPLVDEIDLIQESTRVRNCVGRGTYTWRCVEGSSRIFGLRKLGKPTEAGQKISYIGTVEVTLRNDKTEWYVSQVAGQGNASPTRLMKDAAADVCNRYNSAWQQARDAAVFQ